jgi:hypothetical protein
MLQLSKRLVPGNDPFDSRSISRARKRILRLSKRLVPGNDPFDSRSTTLPANKCFDSRSIPTLGKRILRSSKHPVPRKRMLQLSKHLVRANDPFDSRRNIPPRKPNPSNLEAPLCWQTNASTLEASRSRKPSFDFRSIIQLRNPKPSNLEAISWPQTIASTLEASRPPRNNRSAPEASSRPESRILRISKHLPARKRMLPLSKLQGTNALTKRASTQGTRVPTRVFIKPLTLRAE